MINIITNNGIIPIYTDENFALTDTTCSSRVTLINQETAVLFLFLFGQSKQLLLEGFPIMAFCYHISNAIVKFHSSHFIS